RRSRRRGAPRRAGPAAAHPRRRAQARRPPRDAHPGRLVSLVLRPILRSATHVEWSQFEGMAPLRCTAGVAIPLVVGLTFGQPLVSAFGAIGAVSVGFGSFQGAYRSRAGVMMYAAAAMALSIFAGSLAGHSALAAIAVATLWAFASGLLV